MEKQNNSVGKTVLIVLLLIVTIASLILATFAWAKYTSSVTGNTTAQVAKWNVTFDTNNAKFVQSYTHVIDERIAPGTQGSFGATISLNSDTEVDVDYKVTIESIDVAYVTATGNYVPTTNEDLTGTNLTRPTPVRLPSNMIFKDSAGNTIQRAKLDAVVNTTSGTPVVIADSANSLGGTTLIAKNGSANLTEVLSWEWPYQTKLDGETSNATEDQEDTVDGAYPVTIKINYKVEAWQVKPGGANATAN